MGETEDPKNDSAAKVEKDQKHEKKEKDKHNGEAENGEKDNKDKKKKIKDGAQDKKKDKNPQDKTDPSKLRAKLEKIENKMQDLQLKKDEILKMISEVGNNAAHSSAAPPANA
ncbi:uncharacterized protein [Primulina huaijiensis]|uniref:uncharacterized protein n=1 Tax=Primulina huaijiensis TaxID=1492673 RepID=UPI003CC7476E